MSMSKILFGDSISDEKKPVEKSASTSDDRMKYIKAAIVASVGAAGIGALVRSSRAKKSRQKAMDANQSKNTIIVPVKKNKFMEGLPTPAELAESRGETGQAQPSTVAKDEQQVNAAGDMSPEEIALKKRDILRGRKVNFFGKRASSVEKSKSDGPSASVAKKEVTEEKYDGRTVLRDQSGKFVSPTDPVGVEQVEKKALAGVWDTLLHPIDSAERIGKAMADKPVLFTAGALGSIYIASKISDAINDIRKERAKAKLDSARQKYVDLLEGENEKTAQDTDVRDLTGTVIGTSFLVPMAITALVTNRIIENRRREKAKMKDLSDSYPDDPVILYKTSEGKDVMISPETALVAILVKRAMIESAEAYENGIVKKADFDWMHPIDSATEGLASMYYENKAPVGIENEAMRNAADTAIGYFDKPENEELYLGMMKDIESKKFDDAKAKFKQMIPEDVQRQHSGMFLNNGFIPSLAGYDKFHNSVVGHYNDPRFKSFAADKKSRIDNYLTFGGALKQGGLLHNILSWFMNTLGLGNGMFNAKLRNQLNGFAGQGDLNNAGSQTQDQQGDTQGARGSVVITR